MFLCPSERSGEAAPGLTFGPRIEGAAPKDNLITVFEKWLILKDHTPIYAMLGAIAANLLPGDPVWLGLIAPPSSAKTELLNSISGLPHVI